ncbi:porin family protein [Carboxylicivirga linearis]|uniref:PorT family protein n=1 Tax=Carboxylicivirga linearis TaxID=1628157 RepID=A0ABS5JPC6_9BACT|nr:porin family protein [Carboxylicivirga linearis]MBS2096684.1 PorT family protein [Carboxylicivirga linearis]
MKKQILILFISLFCFITIQAQEFRAGFTGGPTMSQVDGDTYAGFNKLGFSLGGFVSRQISPSIDLQFDISYIQKGARRAPNIEKAIYDDYEIDLGYIQFPVTARYHFRDFSVEGGIAIATLLHDDEFWDEQSIKGNEGVPPFKSLEFSTVFGLNYHISERLWINGRLLYSLNRIRIPYDGELEIYDPKKHWLSRKPGQYNNNIVFSVYYAINRL